MKARHITQSFNYAILGVFYAMRNERNLRIHVAAAILVLLAALYYGVSRAELLIILCTASLVVFAELVNTAVEAVVNLLTLSRHPLAKIAKDVAAGGVLIAVLNALVVGYLIFYDRIRAVSKMAVTQIRVVPVHLVVVALVVVLILVMAAKTFGGKGTPLRGGIVSGHTAVAFAATTAIFWLTSNVLATSLAVLISLLVAQSRVETGAHAWWEVVGGAFLGVLATLTLFKVFAMVRLVG